MDWIDNLQGDNFLAVVDVMIDIKNEIDIMADEILIPIMQTIIKFPELLPIDSTNMRDKYCSLRWKATKFLEKNGIINKLEIHKPTHRWEGLMGIDLDKNKFMKEHKKIVEEYKKREESSLNVKGIVEKRFQFINELYKLSNADEREFLQSYDIGKKLGLRNEFTTQVMQYLEGEGLITFATADMSTLRITHKGIVEVERALLNPNESTDYFQARNVVINVDKMIGSQIQIGSPHGTQIQTSDNELIDKFKELTGLIKQNYAQLELSLDGKKELDAKVQTIDTQISSSRPEKSILNKSLSSIRRILERAGGTIIASKILDKLPAIEEMLENIF